MDADVVGTLASTASVLLNISPIRDVLAIHETRSVTERSILPYCMMMVDGANWVVYAAVVGDFFPIGITNAFGCLCGITYSVVYLRNCLDDKRAGVRRQAWIIFGAALAIVGLVVTSSVVFVTILSSDTATDSIGSFVDIFNVCLYASPLAIAWKVLRTRCTSGMYLPLSITITLASSLWAAYGFLTSDYFVAAPQSVGLLAGLAQLSLFVRFGVADNNQPSEATGALGAGDDPGDGSRHGPGSGGGGRVPAVTGVGPGRLSDGSAIDTAPPDSGRSKGGGGQPFTLLLAFFAAVPSFLSVIFLVWIMGKIDNDLWSRLDTTETSYAAAKQELIITNEELVKTKQQRDDALQKARTTAENSRKQRKVLNDLRVDNALLNDKLEVAATHLRKEKAHHSATKDTLHLVQGEIKEVAGKLAKLDASHNEVAVKSTEVDVEKEKNHVLAQSLAEATSLQVKATTKLREQKLENGVLLQRLAACTAGLAAANEKILAKDAVISAQNFKVGQGLVEAMDQAKTIATLRLNLERATAKTALSETDFRFHYQLQIRSANIAKATAVRLQTELNELQDAMASLQLSATSSAATAAAAATAPKQDPTAVIPDDSSTGTTVSTTLSGSGSGSVSVSRANSGISTSTNSDDNGVVQSVESAISYPPIPAAPSASNAGAAPAVVHTGPHNKPKRVKRNKQGQKHDGKTRSTANATKRKQAGLSRGYTGGIGG
eukprot:g12652.t1